MMPIVVVVCLLTFVHYVGAQMRGPILPLYAAASGATPTGVGLIVAAHMMAAAFGSIPLGRAADVWGRRPLLLGGMVIGVATSLLLPFVRDPLALVAVYGFAGFGVAAFTPSALSLVGDAAAPGKLGSAFAWYTTAHYGAIGVGSFVGGLAAEWWGFGVAFVASAACIAVALVGGVATSLERPVAVRRADTVRLAEVSSRRVWAGWLIGLSGLLTQGVVFTFWPLLAVQRGFTPGAIGAVFLVVGVCNTLARFPAGWFVDRSRHVAACAVGGVLIAAAATAMLPHAGDHVAILGLMAVFGAFSGASGVATGAALASATPAVARGLVMGGYSTALYLGLALGSFALGPVVTHHGYAIAFGAGGMLAGTGALFAAALWTAALRRRGNGVAESV